MTLARVTAKKLSEGETDRLVLELVEDMSSLEGLRNITLFGSTAAGKMKEASDIDLVLIFENQTSAKAASKIARTLRRSQWPADLICVSQEHYDKMSEIGGFLYVAKREGKEVYPQ